MANKRQPTIERDTSDIDEDDFFEDDLEQLRQPRTTGEREQSPGVINAPTTPRAEGATSQGTQEQDIRGPQTVPIEVEQTKSNVTPEVPPIVEEIAEATRKPTKTEARQTAIVLMALLDGAASMLIGKEARMNDIEKELIREPLARILQRMDFAANELLAKWSDPILLAMGMVAWLSRISKIANEKKAQEQQPQAQPNQPQQPTTREVPPGSNAQTVEDIPWKADAAIVNGFRTESVIL